MKYPCKNCEKFDDRENCDHYRNCDAWQSWFHKEWTEIQEAAEKMKNGEQIRK